MKKLIELAKSNPPLTIFVVGLPLLLILVFALVRVAGSAINEQRIGALETEKQQILKERDEARARDLILQGKIEAKDEQIQSLTSQIADSNERVVNAHNETQTARTTVNKVRADKPHFNSADDAGRIVELGTGLRELYPDSP